ncbi:MAG: hypothetical protein HQM16_09880 [Deltaproteobacteria bacterium]|nr:hypothetical protein [Deltaproteobacteria bacterium]
MSVAVIISLVIFVLAVWYITQPLLATSSADVAETQDHTLADLTLKKNEVLIALKDIEMDHQMQKISEDDYTTFYGESFEQGRILLEKIETITHTKDNQ